MKSTEKSTQMAILNYLDYVGIVAHRNNSGFHICPATGRRIMLGPAGSPDIIGLTKKGRWLGIEVKDTHAYQNPNQKAYQKKVEASGGLYILAKSLDDVIAALNGT